MLDPVQAIKDKAAPRHGEVFSLLGPLTVSVSEGTPVGHTPSSWPTPSQPSWHHGHHKEPLLGQHAEFGSRVCFKTRSFPWFGLGLAMRKAFQIHLRPSFKPGRSPRIFPTAELTVHKFEIFFLFFPLLFNSYL